MKIFHDDVVTQVQEIVAALPRKKITYSGYWLSSLFTTVAPLLTMLFDQQDHPNIIPFFIILLLAHLAIGPFVIYGHLPKAVNIQFPLIGLMGITRGFTITLLVPVFDINYATPLYVEIIKSVILIVYSFSLFSIIFFFSVTVKKEIKEFIEASTIKSKNLGLIEIQDSHNVLIKKIVDIQKKILQFEDRQVSPEILKARAREIDELIRNEIRPLSHFEWQKGEMVKKSGGVFSVLASALSKRTISVPGITIFTLPFVFSLFPQFGSFDHFILLSAVILVLTWLTWKLMIRSQTLFKLSNFQINLFFIFFHTLIVILMSFLLEKVIGSDIFLTLQIFEFSSLLLLTFLIFALLSTLCLQLIYEKDVALISLRDEVGFIGTFESPSNQEDPAHVRDYAQYLHAEIQSQLMGCKLLLLKLAEEGAPSLTSENLKLINEKLNSVSQPYVPLFSIYPLERINRFLSSWSALVDIDSHLCPELDQLREVGIHTAQIIEESIVNAVRHGLATQIGVDLRMSGDHLELVIHNNGTLAPSRPGLGSLIFNNFSSQWSIKEVTSGVESRFLIPITKK